MKIDANTVKKIRWLRAEGCMAYSVIADMYGISREEVRDICNRKA